MIIHVPDMSEGVEHDFLAIFFLEYCFSLVSQRFGILKTMNIEL